jgi:hypothetical protein
VACKDVEARLLRVWNRYTQFTCFTGTKVQILTPEAPARVEQVPLPQFTCFTGTKVQILTLRVWSSNVQAEVQLSEQSFAELNPKP